MILRPWRIYLVFFTFVSLPIEKKICKILDMIPTYKSRANTNVYFFRRIFPEVNADVKSYSSKKSLKFEDLH